MALNPGYAEVLRICNQDLSPGGHVAPVDFPIQASVGFRRRMDLNHVRDGFGQIPSGSPGRPGSISDHCKVISAYGGLWHWFSCLASR